MKITIDEQTHTYLVNGDIASVSVTELLKKHGLSPNYGKVSKKKLEEKAEIGKKVHEDLEFVLNKPKYAPTTPQGEHFAQWVKENLSCGAGEQKLALDYKGMIVAGTADVMAIDKDGNFVVADHKNTSVFHREYVSWQVSLLDYMARHIGKEPINGKTLNWKGATKFYCFHYDPKSGDMKTYELEKVEDGEIEFLLECEFNGEKYYRKTLMVDPELRVQFEKAENYLIEAKAVYDKAKAEAEAIRKQLLDLFEKQNILSWETPDKRLLVTYVCESDRLMVDSEKLKREFPDIFTKCQKLTKVKANVRIKVREGGNDNDD